MSKQQTRGLICNRLHNGPKNLSEFPEEIVVEIWDYLYSNRDMMALRKCCKRFKTIGDQYGFIRYLDLSYDADYMNLMALWGKANLKGLRTLSVRNWNSPPASWIPLKWPLHVLFSNCRMGTSVISPPKSPTTELVVTDVGTGTLRMDWSKLPNLKVLDLHVYNADLSGLSQCTGLESIRLYFKTRGKKFLPAWVASLPRLVAIRTNLVPNSKMHFLSKHLKICLVPKRKRANMLAFSRGVITPCTCKWDKCVPPYSSGPCEHFTAVSTQVPWRHLMCTTGYAWSHDEIDDIYMIPLGNPVPGSVRFAQLIVNELRERAATGAIRDSRNDDDSRS
jgi:hypothetical protein